jgi:crotonobetainyl-CoA:carnitine CoA-transferase CaiB-like acyl-CoA transferase
MEPYVPAYEKTGFVPTRLGGRLPNSTPNNHYPTQDGQHIHITAGNMPTWRRLCAAMGREDLLSDPRLPDQVALNEHEDEIDGIVGEWTLQHRLGALEEILEEASVPAARIYTMADVFDDPHYKAREMIVEVPDDDLGTVKLANVVPRLSATPGEIRKAGGQPGVDTADVLLELAGLDAAAIAALEADGIIYCGEEIPAATREAD